MYDLNGIYDSWKTTELVLQGTLSAHSRLRCTVDISTLLYNETDGYTVPQQRVAFARLQAVADIKDATIRDAVLFTIHSQAPLVETVRRHNVLRQITFTLENLTIGAIPLTMSNGADDTGQVLPAGLLIAIGGEPGAPLWTVAQTHVAQPNVTDAPGAFLCKDRFGGSLRCLCSVTP